MEGCGAGWRGFAGVYIPSPYNHPYCRATLGQAKAGQVSGGYRLSVTLGERFTASVTPLRRLSISQTLTLVYCSFC